MGDAQLAAGLADARAAVQGTARAVGAGVEWHGVPLVDFAGVPFGGDAEVVADAAEDGVAVVGPVGEAGGEPGADQWAHGVPSAGGWLRAARMSASPIVSDPTSATNSSRSRLHVWSSGRAATAGPLPVESRRLSRNSVNAGRFSAANRQAPTATPSRRMVSAFATSSPVITGSPRLWCRRCRPHARRVCSHRR